MGSERFEGKLRSKIFWIIAVVSIGPLIIAGLLSFSSINSSHKLDVGNLEDAIIRQKSKEIKSFVENNFNALDFQTDIEEGGIGIDTQEFFLDGLIKSYPDLEEVSFISLSGLETSRLNRMRPGIYDDKNVKDQRNNISLIEKFSELKAGRKYMSPVNFTLRGPMITIASPVRKKSGEVTLFLSAELNLSKLDKIIRAVNLGSAGYLYLVDDTGFPIASGLNTDIGSLESFSRTAIVRNILSGKSFLGPDGQQRYVNVVGEEVVAAGAFMPDFKWGLVAEWPTKEADSVVTNLFYRNLVITLIVIVAVILISILLATLIVGPIKSLEAGVQLVARGKFDEPVSIKTGDEIEELGVEFNKMMVGLKQLQQLKDEFVFIAAHELRTPVTAMKGYLSLILDGTTGPVGVETKNFIEKVIHANQRLIQLVNDLLEVARSEAGRLTVQVSPVEVVKPIEEVLSELKPLADEKSVKLEYTHGEVPRIMADTDRLKEVLVNLIGNSIKYMGPPREAGGTGTVTVSHEVLGKDLITRIKDTGLGMSKDAQAKLFEKFYRVQTDKTRDITGTGLGLFIVKQIIEKMNGKIWAESEEGRGSTFSFSLPLA